jgi:hypothetical protein
MDLRGPAHDHKLAADQKFAAAQWRDGIVLCDNRGTPMDFPPAAQFL